MADAALKRIVQIALPTQNLEAAKVFYTEKLGLPLLFEAGAMAFFDAGGVRLLLGPPEAPDKAVAGGAVYFEPADLPASRTALEEKGVEFLGPGQTVQKTEHSELQIHFFRDPDGNLLGLMGEVAL